MTIPDILLGYIKVYTNSIKNIRICFDTDWNAYIKSEVVTHVPSKEEEVYMSAVNGIMMVPACISFVYIFFPLQFKIYIQVYWSLMWYAVGYLCNESACLVHLGWSVDKEEKTSSKQCVVEALGLSERP